jgi:hypothetical protein
MHVNYYCDTCGKAYPNEKEAMECEKKHAKDLVILAAHYEEAMEKMKLLATKQYDRSMYFLLEYDDKTDKLKQVAKSKNPEPLIEKLEEVD